MGWCVALGLLVSSPSRVLGFLGLFILALSERLEPSVLSEVAQIAEVSEAFGAL